MKGSPLGSDIGINAPLLERLRSGAARESWRGRSLTSQCIQAITKAMRDHLLKHQFPTILQAQPRSISRFPTGSSCSTVRCHQLLYYSTTVPLPPLIPLRPNLTHHNLPGLAACQCNASVPVLMHAHARPKSPAPIQTNAHALPRLATPHWLAAPTPPPTPPNRNPSLPLSSFSSRYLPRFPVASRLAPNFDQKGMH